MRASPATQPYAKALRTRQVWVATQRVPGCAEANALQSLRRFRVRGLERVNGQALLIAAGQHLQRLLSCHGWGRRPFPNGAAGIVLPALRAKLAVVS